MYETDISSFAEIYRSKHTIQFYTPVMRVKSIDKEGCIVIETGRFVNLQQKAMFSAFEEMDVFNVVLGRPYKFFHAGQLKFDCNYCIGYYVDDKLFGDEWHMLVEWVKRGRPLSIKLGYWIGSGVSHVTSFKISLERFELLPHTCFDSYMEGVTHGWTGIDNSSIKIINKYLHNPDFDEKIFWLRSACGGLREVWYKWRYEKTRRLHEELLFCKMQRTSDFVDCISSSWSDS